MTTGLVFGKFYVFHKGHQYLIDTALSECDKVYVIVCSLSSETFVDGETRYNWIRETYKDRIEYGHLNVIHLNEDWIPQEPSECINHDVFYGTWAGTINALVGYNKIDKMYASEDYVYPMSQHLQCQPRIVDKERTTYPISGTKCRQSIYENWKYLNPIVRKHFVKKVLIIGGESTGKSTMTKFLADTINSITDLSAIGIQEYAREYIDTELDGNMDNLNFGHITHFAQTQMDLVRQAVESGSYNIVISDTDAVVSAVFQSMYHGYIGQEVLDEIEKEIDMWDLIIHLKPTVAWVDDGQRDLGSDLDRKHVDSLISTILQVNRFKNVRTIEFEDFHDREYKAIDYITDMLKNGIKE